MARWGKNIVVPLDSLYKEKENTNRPTAARSAGTVGKWGKMGFTSTRTYALQSITSDLSPGQSPDAATGSTGEGDSSPTRDAPKPKKFFKSRNSATTLVAAQLIQHLPRAPPSPIRDIYPTSVTTMNTTMSGGGQHRSPIKLKVPKAAVAERKNSTSSTERLVKPKKKKEEKKMKPEAPPSRVISRSRKVVNYNEEDDYERCPTPLKDIIVLKTASNSDPEEEEAEIFPSVKSPAAVPVAPPPLPPPVKTPSVDHPPIVLRISKGTSRLVSTDSEEQLNSPQHDFQTHTNNHHSSGISGYNSTSAITSSSSEPNKISTSPNSEKQQLLESQTPTTTTTIPQSATTASPPSVPKIIVKSLSAVPSNSASDNLPPPSSSVATSVSDPSPYIPPPDEPEEFNYCTVKISPDKPPKERLKLIIKTDVIRNALAAAAAAAAAAASNSAVTTDKPEKEKKSKSKKHKHLKHIMATTKEGEFKTPSPQQSTDSNYRTIISPPTLSEKDFDSQSSVLGSISSKGNSTPLAQVMPDESFVIRSRGSSDITSDLETSQHSSLVAPPSDIESRLESMMDGEDIVNEVPKEVPMNEDPSQEDILEILTGVKSDAVEKITNTLEEQHPVEEEPSTKRVTRGKKVKETVQEEPEIKEITSELVHEEPSEEEKMVSPTTRRTRRGNVQQPNPETPTELTTRRTTRRKNAATKTAIEGEPTETFEATEILPTKRGTRSTRNNNLNNNNTNKSPTAKPETVQQPTVVTTPPVIRSYGRKRKNPLPTTESGMSPAKVSPPAEPPYIASNNDITLPVEKANFSLSSSHESGEMETDSIPKTFDEPVSLVIPKLTVAATTSEDVHQRRDYKIKDKFKRTWLERDAREQQEAAEKAAAAEQLAKSSEAEVRHKLDQDQDQELAQPTAMKLVISKKKGSIFKSRVADQFPKRHLYKHRWDEQLNGEQSRQATDPNNSPIPAKTTAGEIFEDFSESCEDTSDVPQPKLTRFVKQPTGANKFDEEPVTSVRCERKAKEYYTVVRNVKTAHQIQEFGEYQEINDDVDYFLEALQPHNQISTRCLSAIKLASKCMTPGFRMHVRAHGVVTKFFKALSDAHKDLSLGLCTSAIMFILSQDALNMDLDRDSLELMMNLLEVDETDPVYLPEITSYNRNKKTVTELCEEIKNQGKATHLNMESISAGTLAMETLLSLTSKRAGEWFKEELRNLGGLEHIIKVICDCCTQITASEKSDSISVSWTPSLLENLKTIERCLRVLENVTQLNEQNQNFILTFGSGKAITTLFTLYKLCDREICLHPTTDLTSKNNPGVILRDALIPTLKVLINITHPFDSNANGSALIGKRHEIFDTSFHILLQAPNYIPERCVFELSMLVLLLLINLTMHTVDNRTFIMKATAPSDFKSIAENIPAVKALIEYFYKCEELARLVEKNTDAILDNTEQKKKQEEVDETVNNLLQKAGHHMEHTLKGSYAGILIGHLVTDSEENETIVRTYLRENGFKEITSVLEKYYTFMNLTASSEATIVSHIKSTKKLIDYLKKRDILNDTGTTATTITTPTKYNDSASTSSNSSPAIATRSTQRVYKTYSQR